MKHRIIINNKENPDFEGHIFIQCDCGWSTDCHENFVNAIKDRHISLIKSEVINGNG